MTEMKKEFLKKSVGFSMEDLSLTRQMELKAQAKSHSWEWVMLALAKDSLEGWEKYGFKLFNKPDFAKEVDELVEAFNNITDEDIKKDREREKRIKAKNRVHYSELHLRKNYEALLGIDDCEWEYVSGYRSFKANELQKLDCIPKHIQELEIIRSCKRKLEDLTEEEKWNIVLSVRRVKYVTVSRKARQR